MLKSILFIVSIFILISSLSLACVDTSQVTENKSAVITNSTTNQIATIDEQKYLLKYDNGVFNSAHYFSDPRGQYVSFSPPVRPFKINTIFIRGKRTNFPNAENKTYTINILDGNFGKPLFSCDYPYSKFSTEYTIVPHSINPPVIVTDNFTVDFISHSEFISDSEKPRVAIYTSYDSSLSTNGHIGLSSLGYPAADEYVEKIITKEPKFSHSVWAIQTEGTGQAISGNPESVITGTENISATHADTKNDLFFKDDFSDPNSGWTIKQTNAGSYKYDNGNYIITVESPGIQIYSSNKNIGALKDLIAEVDIAMESGGKEDYAELIAGWVITKPQSLSVEETRPGDYLFSVYPMKEMTWIATWEKPEWGRAMKAAGMLLPLSRYPAINAGKQNNNLRFVFKGNRVRAYLNNKMMVDTTEENLLFGYRLIDLGLVEGKYIRLAVGRNDYPDNATFKFDNFKLYNGTQKAFLVPEELKDSTLLKEKIKAAEDYGFDIGPIEYYGKTTDYTQSLSKLKEAQPVAIQVIYQPGDKSKLETGMAGYTGEAVYDEVSLMDFALSEITVANSPVKKGEELKISVTAKNTGYLPIKQLSCNYTALNVIGNVLFSGKTEILDLPAGEERIAEIVQGIPLSSTDGDCKLEVVLSAPDTGTSGQSITREKESAFSISGISSGIITGIVISVIVLLGVAVSIFFVIKKKPKKKASA